MTAKDLVGTYTVTGTNQEESQDSGYSGTLTLSLDANGRILAQWLINGTHLQTGSGFFKDDLLIVNFKYTGDDQHVYKGVVAYRCLSPDFLKGFWSEKYGDPMYLGSEECVRTAKKDFLN